jgi:hypothetical protein
MVMADVRDRALPWTELILRERHLPCDLNLRHSHRLSTAAVLTLVAALAATPAFPRLGPALAAGCVLVLIAANLPFYRLLARVGGLGILAAALPLHALHYLCGALGLGAGLVRHFASAWGPSRPRKAGRRAEAEAPGSSRGEPLGSNELAAAPVARDL